MYLNQETEERKEKIKRRGSRVIMITFVGIFILIMVLFITGTQLQRDTEIKGRVLFSLYNHGDYLIVLTNQIISAPAMGDELQGNFIIGDELQKNSGSDTLTVNSKKHILLKFQNIEN
ncbi:hypothetical protein [Algoriphagus winogradskyi]|uniref:Uncharacterized protein n=1 Tax=Algoriphagus winogradskyi TaxID=237017 RepID=A0ABY1PBW7_9BACT|nr:hypothetical protein [Algoriphagus winogradskyi]SMP29764.1 hypothetical protein SAMN06265367_106175 [Algoriphagus winogradskyi]